MDCQLGELCSTPWKTYSRLGRTPPLTSSLSCTERRHRTTLACTRSRFTATKSFLLPGLLRQTNFSFNRESRKYQREFASGLRTPNRIKRIKIRKNTPPQKCERPNHEIYGTVVM